jgi:hypothetical protein
MLRAGARLPCDDASYSRRRENINRSGEKKKQKEGKKKEAPEHPADFSILRPF